MNINTVRTYPFYGKSDGNNNVGSDDARLMYANVTSNTDKDR